MKKKPIVIDVYESKSDSDVVRLEHDAMMLLRRLQRERGHSLRFLASTIIKKAILENGIEFNVISVEEDDNV